MQPLLVWPQYYYSVENIGNMWCVWGEQTERVFFLHSTVVTFVFSEYSCFMSVFYSRELILWMPCLPTSLKFYPILSMLSPSSHSYYSNSMPHSLATANFDEKIYCAYHIHRRCCHSFCSARQTHNFFWRFPDPTLFLTHTNMRSHF